MSLDALFLWPAALPLLLLAPLAWVLLRSHERHRARRVEELAGGRAPVIAAELGARRRRAGRGLFCAGLLLALVAVLQPAWGTRTRVLEQQGLDLVVCLDVSRSMLARDLPPDRLRRAQREIRALAARARDDRLALVVFAGEARLAVPLTRDGESFAAIAGQAGPLSVRLGGTDLGAALEAALEALGERTGKHEAILLLSDGEDLGQRGLAVAEQCRERNIAVHCVGIGSALGSKIALPGEDGESFLRDRRGAEVLTALDSAGLRRIAAASGGAYLSAAGSLQPLLELYEDRIRPLEGRSFAAGESRRRENRFQWPLLAALLLWLLESGLSERRRQ